MFADKDYILKVLGTSPFNGTAPLYVESLYDVALQEGIKSGKTSLNDTRSGVYVGSDGISVGRGFRVDYDGDVTLGTLAELKVGGAVDVYYSYNYRTRIEENRIIFGNANPQPQIRVGDQTLITLTSSSVGLNKDATIGGTSTSCKVGFFGKDGTTQQRVTTLTTGTQNASNVADKLNELIKVLQVQQFNLLYAENIFQQVG